VSQKCRTSFFSSSIRCRPEALTHHC